jgi:hypothetical protein
MGIAAGATNVTDNSQIANGRGYITSYTDTNTQLSDSDIEKMGYIKTYTDTNTFRAIHDTPVDGATTTSISSNWAFDNVKKAVPSNALFTDTNTQLSAAQVRANFSAGTNVSITSAGVISSTDTNTQLSDSDIEKMGYIKTYTDTNTQLSTAQVRAKFSGTGINTSTGVITNTTYSVGDGGLTEKNFTSALNTKLAGIAAGANNYSFPYTVSSAAGNSTVVQRNSSGYIFANYFNGTGTFSTSGATSGMGLFTGTNGTDTYGRSYTAAAARALLNVADGATNVTNNSQIANGRGYITSYTDTNTQLSDEQVAEIVTKAGFVKTDTNTTYTADGNYGITLSGTTFRLEDDRRRNSTGTDVYSGNTHDFTWYDASVGIRWYTAGSEDMRLLDNGTLHVDGDVVAYSSTISDERLKDNIKTIENPLDKIKALRGVEYDWNNGNRKGKHDLGLIAQEVEKVIPNIVHEHQMPLLNDDEEDETLYKTVDYEKLTAVLIEGMKEQQNQIDSLKSELAKIKGSL